MPRRRPRPRRRLQRQVDGRDESALLRRQQGERGEPWQARQLSGVQPGGRGPRRRRERLPEALGVLLLSRPALGTHERAGAALWDGVALVRRQVCGDVVQTMRVEARLMGIFGVVVVVAAKCREKGTIISKIS